MKDFYKILGVKENASQEEIKKTYRELSKIHHPDKGGDETLFKEISESYNTIGDESKRNQYDNQRKNPFNNVGGHGFNPFEEMFNHMNSQRKRSAPDKIIEVVVGVLESFNGSDKKITYERNHNCHGCNGTGGEKMKCVSCNGQGMIIQQIGTGLFTQIIRQPCNSCSGKGFSYRTKCDFCAGSTTISKIETMSIKLPNGIDEGQFLRVQGKGDYKDGTYGNLVIKIKILPQDNFEKSMNDLIYNAYFDLNSLKDESVTIPHPSGNISIKLPNEFDTSKPLRVKNKGYLNDGDLYIKLFVKFNK